MEHQTEVYPMGVVGQSEMEDLGIASLVRVTLVDDHPVPWRLTELGGTV